MPDQNTTTKNLPINALSEIPEPNPDAQHISALKKDGSHVTGYADVIIGLKTEILDPQGFCRLIPTCRP